MQGFPEINEVVKASVRLCQRDARTEEERYGRMPPCRKMAPLSPPLRLDEYFMMERDEGKCTLTCVHHVISTVEASNTHHLYGLYYNDVIV